MYGLVIQVWPEGFINSVSLVNSISFVFSSLVPSVLPWGMRGGGGGGAGPFPEQPLVIERYGLVG